MLLERLREQASAFLLVLYFFPLKESTWGLPLTKNVPQVLMTPNRNELEVSHSGTLSNPLPQENPGACCLSHDSSL